VSYNPNDNPTPRIKFADVAASWLTIANLLFFAGLVAVITNDGRHLQVRKRSRPTTTRCRQLALTTDWHTRGH